MAERQKDTSSTVNSKKKSPLLDEDIGGDFLKSWKSATGGEDSLDFSCDSVPQGRKKTFDFDKMDIDFALGGGFEKISSFKVDMSDLDFSSPPRKAEKAKESSGKESLQGKQEGKRDRFTFSFDFNELDGFDLDSSLLKGEKKAGKPAVSKAVDSPIKHGKSQHSTSNSVSSMDTFGINITKKLPMLDSEFTSKSGHHVSGHVDIDISNDRTPCSKSPGNENASPASTSPEKQITTMAQEGSRESSGSQQHKEKSEMIGSIKRYAQHAIHDTSIQSVPADESLCGTVPKLQTGLCSMDAEKDTNAYSENGSVKYVASSHSQNSSPVNSYVSKGFNPARKRDSQYSDTEFQITSGSQDHVARGKTTRNEWTEAKKGVRDAAIETTAQEPHIIRDTGENLKSIRLPLSPFHSTEARPNKHAPLKEKDADGISKYFRRSEDTNSQLPTPLFTKEIDALCDKTMEAKPLGVADVNSHESKGRDGHTTIQKFGTLKSLIEPVTKGLSVIQGSEKKETVCNTSRPQVHTVNFPIQTIPASTPKNVNPKLMLSSIMLISNSKIASVERPKLSPLNADRKKFEISSLKISRNLTSKSESSKNPSQKETNSVKHSERKMGTAVNKECKMVHYLNTEKLTLLSPSLKRKSFEGSNTDPGILNPLKRTTESPSESRKPWEDPQTTEEKGPSLYKESNASAESLEDRDRDIHYIQPTSTLDLPLESSMADLEVLELIESDGNVEKAEACSKKLEDICNMLKKKQDEAKELLVRAIVNNNQLLMLNHPIYEEKIRTIQRYAGSLLSMERQP